MLESSKFQVRYNRSLRKRRKMKKKAKTISITESKLESRNSLITLLLLVTIFGVLLYFHSSITKENTAIAFTSNKGEIPYNL